MERRKPMRQYKVRGMDCAEEIALLKRELGPLVGGEAGLSFDLLRAKVTLLDPPPDLDDRTVLRAVERTGMQAQAWSEAPARPQADGFWTRRARTLLTLASGAGAAAGF